MKITLKNIKSYVQGNSRLLMKKYGPEFMQSPWWVQEQVAWRPTIANPKCIEQSKCVGECGCAIPGKFYSSAECDEGCYPEIMNEAEWTRFKEIQEANNLDPRLWKEIIQIMEDTAKVVDNNKWMKDLGKIGKNVTHYSSIDITNDYGEDMKIDIVATSCPCVKVGTKLDKIKQGETVNVKLSVDTTGKGVGTYKIYIRLKYNNIKRVKYGITFEVI